MNPDPCRFSAGACACLAMFSFASAWAAGPDGGSCRVVGVRDIGVMPLASAAARTTVMTVVRKAPRAAAGTAPGALAPPKDARDAVHQAIRRRDLAAFLQALPPDAAGRDRLLDESFALDGAFREAALPIVRQILAWHPAALAERFANSNTIGLESVSREWVSLDESARAQDPVENPPADADYVELLRLLLAAGAKPDGLMDWKPPLAAVAGLPASPASNEAARLLLEAGANVNAPRAGAVAPLVAAAEAQNAASARLMLATGRVAPETLETALVRSPLVGANAALPLLLEAGADINTRRPPGPDPRVAFTPAQSASLQFRGNGEPGLMQLMIRYRVDPNRLSRPGVVDSPLMNVLADPELTEGLLRLGADANYRNAAGDTPLLLAVRLPAGTAGDAGRAETIAALLAHGADPQLANAAGATPLKETRDDDGAIIETLLAHGGDWKVGENDLGVFRAQRAPAGAFAWALLNHKDALAAATLAHGERPDANDCGIVYYAAASGSTRTLAWLLGSQVGDTRVRDGEAHTVLMAAAGNGHAEAVRLLLEHGDRSLNERVACGVALVGGHGPPFPGIVGGQSALMLAAFGRHADVVRELLKRGADARATDCNGRGAIAYALESGAGAESEIVRVLREAGGRE